MQELFKINKIILNIIFYKINWLFLITNRITSININKMPTFKRFKLSNFPFLPHILHIFYILYFIFYIKNLKNYILKYIPKIYIKINFS